MTDKRYKKRIEFDTDYLFRLSIEASPTAFRIFMLLLRQRESNDGYIHMTIGDMRAMLGATVQMTQPFKAIQQLEKYNIVSRPAHKYNMYKINPEYTRLITE